MTKSEYENEIIMNVIKSGLNGYYKMVKKEEGLGRVNMSQEEGVE